MRKNVLKSKALLHSSVAASIVASMAVAIPANAQESEEPRAGLNQIVVTARKTEENVQTTPVAVTAIGSEALKTQQITDLTDLQRSGPGFLVRTGLPGLGTYSFVAIRGQGNFQGNLSNDPSVGIYLDGVYIPRPMKGIANMRDLDRVEVLRGPQGTLFGRNTTGGALQIVSNDPVNAFEARINGEIGNFDHRNVGAVVNVPLNDDLAARIVYNYSEADGYGYNAALDRDMQSNRTHLIRGKLKYEGDGFDVTIGGDYTKYDDNGTLVALADQNPNFVAFHGPGVAGAFHDRDAWWTTFGSGLVIPTTGANGALFPQLSPEARAFYDSDQFNTMETWGANLTINAEIGNLDLKSVTGYRNMDTQTLTDTDGTPAPILSTNGIQVSKQFSEELQVSGDLSDRLGFIAGGYYGRETGVDQANSQVFGGLIRNSFSTVENVSTGLFAQLYYDITDTLHATAGFRYTWDSRKVFIQNRQVLGLPPGFVTPAGIGGTGFNCQNDNIPSAPVAEQAALAAECFQPKSVKYDYPAWTLGLDWEATPDIFAYIKTSHAARSGGWNFRAGVLPSFAPEKVYDVEGGVKLTLLDNRLRTNVALFHSWRNSIQASVQTFIPGIGPNTFVQNNGNARIWGAEFEVVAQPWEGMEINAGLSLLDGKYEDGTFTEFRRFAFAGPTPQGCVATTGVPGSIDCQADLSGTSILQLPEAQWNIGATQTFYFGDNELRFHVDYSHVSSQVYFETAAHPAESDAAKASYAAVSAASILPSYGYANGRISYEFVDRGLELYLYARNLTNEKYLSGRYGELYNSLGFVQNFPGAPRMWGGGINIAFGGAR